MLSAKDHKHVTGVLALCLHYIYEAVTMLWDGCLLFASEMCACDIKSVRMSLHKMAIQLLLYSKIGFCSSQGIELELNSIFVKSVLNLLIKSIWIQLSVS